MPVRFVAGAEAFARAESVELSLWVSTRSCLTYIHYTFVCFSREQRVDAIFKRAQESSFEAGVLCWVREDDLRELYKGLESRLFLVLLEKAYGCAYQKGTKERLSVLGQRVYGSRSGPGCKIRVRRPVGTLSRRPPSRRI